MRGEEGRGHSRPGVLLIPGCAKVICQCKTPGGLELLDRVVTHLHTPARRVQKVGGMVQSADNKLQVARGQQYGSRCSKDGSRCR
jgi:hypothetical protein